MEHMATQSEMLEAFREEGFTEDLSIADNGRIEGEHSCWEAADVVVNRVARFEGMSDPGDESILLAVTGPDGTKGALTLPYGPEATGDQADAMRALLIIARDVAEPPDSVH